MEKQFGKTTSPTTKNSFFLPGSNNSNDRRMDTGKHSPILTSFQQDINEPRPKKLRLNYDVMSNRI